MLGNIAGNKLSNPDSEYYQTVVGEMHNLSQDKFKHINKDQLIAVLMTENDHLRSQSNGPTLPETVMNNRNTNNTIMSNNRSANLGGSGLSEILKGNERLTKSKQGSNGTLNQVIRELDAVKSFRT